MLSLAHRPPTLFSAFPWLPRYLDVQEPKNPMTPVLLHTWGPQPAPALPGLSLCFPTPKWLSQCFPTPAPGRCGISAVKLPLFSLPKQLCPVAELMGGLQPYNPTKRFRVKKEKKNTRRHSIFHILERTTVEMQINEWFSLISWKCLWLLTAVIGFLGIADTTHVSYTDGWERTTKSTFYFMFLPFAFCFTSPPFTWSSAKLTLCTPKMHSMSPRISTKSSFQRGSKIHT